MLKPTDKKTSNDDKSKKQEEKTIKDREKELDQDLEDTFPASDPRSPMK